ncbi:MAG TPA: hypothetical protein VLA12_22980, partial [Planctomycetaceae bacterium]|nr:hypothetical protein [Planctomycetaceae bacterium]
DGFNFGGHSHTPVFAESQPQPEVIVRKPFGIRGEFHLIGETGGRNLSCRMTIDDLPSRGLVESNLQTINNQIGKLTGDLTETLPDGGTTVFQNCTFLGAQELGPPFLDGSGRHGWVQFVVLHWRSASPFGD